jgi:hypothetical protein
MKRRVIECKGGSFSGSIECSPDALAGAVLASLDVRGRQRSQRARDLLNPQIGEIPALGRRQPPL